MAGRLHPNLQILYRAPVIMVRNWKQVNYVACVSTWLKVTKGKIWEGEFTIRLSRFPPLDDLPTFIGDLNYKSLMDLAILRLVPLPLACETFLKSSRLNYNVRSQFLLTILFIYWYCDLCSQPFSEHSSHRYPGYDGLQWCLKMFPAPNDSLSGGLLRLLCNVWHDSAVIDILQELQIFFERIIPNDGAGERAFSLAAHSAVHLIEPLEVWVCWVSLQESNHSPSPSSQRAARDIWIRMLLRVRGVNELWNTCSTQTRMPGRPRKRHRSALCT